VDLGIVAHDAYCTVPWSTIDLFVMLDDTLAVRVDRRSAESGRWTRMTRRRRDVSAGPQGERQNEVSVTSPIDHDSEGLLEVSPVPLCAQRVATVNGGSRKFGVLLGHPKW
jgi:hypothetical protein